MDRTARFLLGLIVVAFASSAAYAQQDASITGRVTDSSGGVLPGVTVEASSPALIEKVRTVVTDGTGQYRIVSLRPGTYAVTFTLTGFSVVRRDGVELTGSFTATVNAELRVGELTETLTVTGESPVVDVQGVKRERILSKEVVDALPSGRTNYGLVALIPGTSNAWQDVGGTQGTNFSQPTIHGSAMAETRTQVDGFTFGPGYQYQFGHTNMSAAQEVNIGVGAAGADQPSAGGLVIDFIPKGGGNQFSGSFFATGANEHFQSNNFTQRLKDKGVPSVTRLKGQYDVNGGVGGPILRDRLWFYAAARAFENVNYVGGVYYNKNAGLANVWTYDPDLSQPATSAENSRQVSARITWQMDAKNKFNFYVDDQSTCQCRQSGPGGLATRLLTPEAATTISFHPYSMVSATWQMPLTNRILFEAGIAYNRADNEYVAPPAGSPLFDLIPVTDSVITTTSNTQETFGLQYHGRAPVVASIYQTSIKAAYQPRAAFSYVSGAHAFKVGFSAILSVMDSDFTRDNNAQLRYTFNRGVPTSLTQVAPNYISKTSLLETGIYAQDRWTVKRLTINLGVRYNGYHSYYPDTSFGPGLYNPTRNFTIPAGDYFQLRDVSPKLGVAYDLFGTGKTAIKASLNKNMFFLSTGNSPANVVVNTAARSWNDSFYPVGDPRRGNFTPDCNLVLTPANGECGALPATFGLQVPPSAAVDPNAITGWGNRQYSWEFSTGVQHEILPRVSLDVTYFRRWVANALITYNRALSPSDYSPYSVTAPVDPRLPNGGGYVVSGLLDLNPTKAAGGIPTNNFQALSDSVGNQINHWNGVDFTVNARPRAGLVLAGGVSTGRTSTDNCAVVANAVLSSVGTGIGPTTNNPSTLYCHIDTAFLTQVKAYGTYTIPRVDIQVSGTLQNIPGPQLQALVGYSSATVAQTLGRGLSTANLSTVNVIQPGTEYGERHNQLDLRVGKILKFGRTRTAVNFNLYNALNADTVLVQNDIYTPGATNPWQTPITVVQGRLAKISVDFNF